MKKYENIWGLAFSWVVKTPAKMPMPYLTVYGFD